MSSVIGHTIGRGPAHSSARSAPLHAPITPGISSALDTSTFVTRACANGLRTSAMWTMPCRVMLSTKLPCPCNRDASSLRRTGCPTYRSETAMSSFSVTAMSAPYALAPDIWPAASRIDATMFW